MLKHPTSVSQKVVEQKITQDKVDLKKTLVSTAMNFRDKWGWCSSKCSPNMSNVSPLYPCHFFGREIIWGQKRFSGNSLWKKMWVDYLHILGPNTLTLKLQLPPWNLPSRSGCQHPQKKCGMKWGMCHFESRKKCHHRKILSNILPHNICPWMNHQCGEEKTHTYDVCELCLVASWS